MMQAELLDTRWRWRVIWYVKRVCMSMNKLGYNHKPWLNHGERHVFLAHRFIYLYFSQISDQSMEIDHKDENRANN
jgi:hypothetical protein